jgi:hypothetical protein
MIIKKMDIKFISDLTKLSKEEFKTLFGSKKSDKTILGDTKVKVFKDKPKSKHTKKTNK